MDMDDLLYQECLAKCSRPDERERLDREWGVLVSTGVLSKIEALCNLRPFLSSCPFFLRGSAGGSLVLHLLGLTEFHPIDYGLVFERFIATNKSIGDIDIDVSPEFRPLIFRELGRRFPDRAGRLSNRNYFRQRSSLRQYMKEMLGVQSRRETRVFLDSLPPVERAFLQDDADRRFGKKFRHYSLHVGGVVLFDEPIPKKLCLTSGPEELPRLAMDKHDVEKQGFFKIDFLNNHAIGFLHRLDPANRRLFDVENDSRCLDQEVFEMIQRGDTLGVIYGESPLIRQCFKSVKPRTIIELGICFGLIRPMNRRFRPKILRGEFSLPEHRDTPFFDDDWIRDLSKKFGVSLQEAELERKKIRKGEAPHAMKGYGFCRSHAYHYGLLIFMQCWYKCHSPLLFYQYLLQDVYSRAGTRMFDPWVYVLDAFHHHVFFKDTVPPLKKKIKNTPRPSYGWKPSKRWKDTLVPDSGIQTRLWPESILSQIRSTGMFATRSGKDLQCLHHAVAHYRVYSDDCVFAHYYDHSEGVFKDLVIPTLPIADKIPFLPKK